MRRRWSRGRWVCALLAALFLSGGWCPRAEAGKAEADRLCERADRAERDALDFERKSEERRRFLAGKGGIGSGGNAPAGLTSAAKQSIRAQVRQAQEILPQIRQGIAAAQQDGAFAPGLSRYFQQMESCISAALPAVEACLNAPERCSVPMIRCPAPPSIAPYAKNNASTAGIRHIQESYRQASNMAHQACLNLKNTVSRDLQRLDRDGGSGATAAAGSAGTPRFGDTDLYLVKAGNLKREASGLRLDADRISGVGGYCAARTRTVSGARQTTAPGTGATSGGTRAAKAGSGIPEDGKVADLKADWNAKWSGDKVLRVSDVPPPGPSEAAPGETVAGRVGEYLSEKGPWWWYKAKSAYRKADEQVELTEFIKSRPVELLKDIATEYVEWRFGAVGKSATTGYKILGAVQGTADEVGGILGEAPAVIAHGGAAETRALYQRADRVPLKLYNDLFDDVVGKFPPPRYGSASGKAAGNE